MQRGQACWYRQPVVWLGALIFIALVAGCISLIVVSARYSEDALPAGSDHVLKVPIARVEQAPPAAASGQGQ